MAPTSRNVGVSVQPLIDGYKEIMVVDDKGQPLPCYGCAHSTAYKAFPSRPSGEQPCQICIRNKERYDADGQYAPISKEQLKATYGIPVKKAPMDCYISLDKQMQLREYLVDREKQVQELLNRKGHRKVNVNG